MRQIYRKLRSKKLLGAPGLTTRNKKLLERGNYNRTFSHVKAHAKQVKRSEELHIDAPFVASLLLVAMPGAPSSVLDALRGLQGESRAKVEERFLYPSALLRKKTVDRSCAGRVVGSGQGAKPYSKVLKVGEAF